MEARQITFKHSQVLYRVVGDGPPVMLVHGFGEAASIWDMLLGELSKSFTLLMPDLPGSGASPNIGAGTKEDHLSLEDHAEVLNEILKEEGIENLIMIGHSMGGYITLAFAERYPRKLLGFGLFHSSAFADNDEKKETRLKAIDFINKNGALAFLKTATPALFAANYRDAHAEAIESMVNTLYGEFTKEALTGYYYAMINRPDRTEVLKNFEKPILLILGEEDPAVPLEAGLKQTHMPQEAHVHILPGVGHMGMIESFKSTGEMVADFCKHCYEKEGQGTGD